MTEPTRAPVQYVLVRRDLPWRVQMVMVGHAAAEAVRVAPIDKRTILRLLHVADEAELVAYAGRLEAKRFEHDVVVELDGPYAGQAMSLATAPRSDRVGALGKLLYHLEAVREPAELIRCSSTAEQPGCNREVPGAAPGSGALS